MSNKEKKQTKPKATKVKKTPSNMEVRSPDYLSVVIKHLTKSLCEEVFAATREVERQRKWSLFVLAWFWIGLLQSHIASQTRAILEAQKGNPLFPAIDASPESFFMKIQKVRPTFFKNIFFAFTQAIFPEFQPTFASSVCAELAHFPDILAIDGSRLEKVGRLLKATRSVVKAILPGSLEALYDVRRGCLRDLWFDPDGHASEISMFEKVLGSIPAGALLLADRYYSKPAIWRALEQSGIFMVSRWNKTVKKLKVEVLTKRRGKICIDDWIVMMGGSDGTTPVRLRWVHAWGDGFDVVLLTNALDPIKLTAMQIIALYRKRWSIERMYLAMKDVLDLNSLYNCSPAAVAQQVYATAILYNALRLAQSKLAEKSGIVPDDISEQKLFPVLIDNFLKATFMEAGAERMFESLAKRLGNPDLERPEIDLDHPSLNIRIRDFLVEKRSGTRRIRRYCKGRVGHTAFGKMPGTKKYLAN
jgi:hypothetical protein